MQESSHEMSQRTQPFSSIPGDSNSVPFSLCRQSYWQRIKGNQNILPYLIAYWKGDFMTFYGLENNESVKWVALL